MFPRVRPPLLEAPRVRKAPLELITPPSSTDTVVSVAAMREWVGLVHNQDDQKLISLVLAATNYCESEIPGARQIRQATFDLKVSRWWAGEMFIPRPPLQSVGSVKYYDQSGTLQTLDSANYQVRTPWRGVGALGIKLGTILPTFDVYQRWPIVVRFTAGFTGTAGQGVPEEVVQAVRFLVTQWYDNREPLGRVTEETGNAVRALLASVGWGAYE